MNKYRLSSDCSTTRAKARDKDKEKPKRERIELAREEKVAVFAVLVGVPLVLGMGLLLRPLFTSRGTVHGKVTLNGAPVPWGRISFVGQAGAEVVKTSPIKNGSYEIKDCPSGPVKIAVESFQATARTAASATNPMVKGFAPPKGTQPPSEVVGKYLAIPPRYGSAETSGLGYAVRRGGQEHDVPLSP
jgi:hypothetical protein